MNHGPLPTTAAEFHAAMLAIDAKLQSIGVAIPHRCIHAATEYHAMFGKPILLFSKKIGTDGVFWGADAGAHIVTWYDTQYGERSHMPDSGSTIVVVLRGDPWEAVIGRTYGRVHLVADPNVDAYLNAPSLQRSVTDPPVVVNAVSRVRHLPRVAAMALSATDCSSLLQQYKLGLDGCNAIAQLFGLAFVREALADLSAAVRHMIGPPPHYGQARYSASLAAEKLLKCALRTRGISFERIHHVDKLAERLVHHAGMPPLPIALIADAKATPDMHYGTVSVGMSEAVRAQNAALRIACHIRSFLEPELAARRSRR